jgi:hypothetical protein
MVTTRLLTVLLAGAFVLSACNSAPRIDGNQYGGTISWEGGAVPNFHMADQYCAQFGRVARVTQVNRNGIIAAFDCVRP